MTVQERVVATMMAPEQKTLEEGAMVHKERWEEVRRRYFQERKAIAEIARGLDMDRKTVRRCVHEEQWQPYHRVRGGPTLLSAHEEYLRQRAEEVGYSAQILYQDLRARGYRGSYETVKLFVRPLRTRASSGEQTLKRFETAPGHQSQIDWGQARVYFGGRGVTVHLFVLTLGYSRRSFYRAYPNEQLGAFLEAHEGAFEHFGGHTREHLYDRTRTVCRPGESGRATWNVTFLAFAEYWGFEPRLCQPYRARTKGKVESGVKYVKRNFILYLPEALHPCNPGSCLGATSAIRAISTRSCPNGRPRWRMCGSTAPRTSGPSTATSVSARNSSPVLASRASAWSAPWPASSPATIW
jgi:transposase